MPPFLLTPPSLQYLAQALLAATLATYLAARPGRDAATGALAGFFAGLAAGIGLLFLDQTITSPRGNLFVDAAPLAFLAGGACLVDFAGRFPARPSGSAGRAWRAVGRLAVAGAVALAAPNLWRSARGLPNPPLPFRLQLVAVSALALVVVGVLAWRSRREEDRRTRGALAAFAGLGALLCLLGVAAWLGNAGRLPPATEVTVRTVGLFAFLSAFVVVHLNASPVPSRFLDKLVGLALLATWLTLALAAAAVLPPSVPADRDLAARLAQHRQAVPLAALMVALPALLLVGLPLILRAGFSQPLAALLRGVESVGRGDLEGEVPVRLNDEIGRLAAAFNGMVRSLREAQATRERLAVLERDLAVARSIQQALLPATLPPVPGVRLAVRLVSTEAVSGDFYDVAAVPGGIALLAADVSGHGIPAALIATMAKQAFGQARSLATEPGALLAAVNDALVENTGGQFLSAVCAYVDPARNLARIGSAGHPPALLVRGHDVRTLKPDGLLAGLLPGVAYESLEVAVAPGDRLVLFTDGVTECGAERDEEFGPERLASLLGESSGLDTDACAERILAALRDWNGGSGSFADDVTLVVADVVPAAAP